MVVVTSFECDADGIPEGIFGPCRNPRQDGFDLGEELLDRIEIGAVGRQVEDRCADAFDGLTHAVDFVCRQVVHDHDITRFECRREELLGIGAKGSPVIGPSSTSGAMIPLLLSPATKVVVFQ